MTQENFPVRNASESNRTFEISTPTDLREFERLIVRADYVEAAIPTLNLDVHWIPVRMQDLQQKDRFRLKLGTEDETWPGGIWRATTPPYLKNGVWGIDCIREGRVSEEIATKAAE